MPKCAIFDDVERDRRLTKSLRQRPTARNCNIGAKNLLVLPVIAVSGCRSSSRSPGAVSSLWVRGRKPHICRRNFSDICHTVGDISTSGLDGHIAISGYLSMSHLFVDTFFEFGVVYNFVYRARITVILTWDPFGCTSLCSRWRPIATSGFVCHLENVQIPLFTLLPRRLTIFGL